MVNEFAINDARVNLGRTYLGGSAASAPAATGTLRLVYACVGRSHAAPLCLAGLSVFPFATSEHRVYVDASARRMTVFNAERVIRVPSGDDFTAAEPEELVA